MSAAYGQSSEIVQQGNVAITYDPNTATTEGNLTVDGKARAKGSLEVGPYSYTKTTGVSSVAIGNGAVASSENAFALGSWTAAEGPASVAMGNGAVAGYSHSVALGFNAKSSSDSAYAMGSYAEAIASNSYAFGPSAKAVSYNSIAFGENAVSQGGNGTAIGSKAKALFYGAIAVGVNSEAKASFGAVLGSFATSDTFGQTTIGRYNSPIVSKANSADAWFDDDPLFIVGNGKSAETLPNALVVYKNGDAEVGGKLTVKKAGGGISMGEFGPQNANEAKAAETSAADQIEKAG